MDQIKKLSAGHSIEVLDAIMTEVEEARGEHESLDARLDEISGEGYSKAEVDALLALKQNALNSTQLAAVNSGIDSTKVAQIETNKNNILSLTPTISSKKYITIAADTWEDTGYAITIPAGKTAIFSASAEYTNRAPLGIALATGDPTTSTSIFAIQERDTTNSLGQLTLAGVIDCRQRSAGRTVNLYVKYANTHTNGNVVCLTYTLL